eukprot:494391_1
MSAWSKLLFHKSRHFSTLTTHAKRNGSLISFMGIPGSGKSYLAERTAKCLNLHYFLEPAEEAYSYDLKQACHKSDYLNIFKGFRNMRIPQINEAKQLADSDGKNVIIDSLYDKLMYKLIHTDECDWLIPPQHHDFPEISTLARIDYFQLPDPDIIFFLKMNNIETYTTLISMRGRNYEPLFNVLEMQNIWYNITKEYANTNKNIPYN